MCLFAGVSAKPVSGIHFEADQVTVEMFALCAQVRRLWVAVPFDPRAGRVDQLCFQPFGHDFFIIGGIGSITSCICRFRLRFDGQCAGSHKRCANEQRKHFHELILRFPGLFVQRNDRREQVRARGAFI